MGYFVVAKTQPITIVMSLLRMRKMIFVPSITKEIWLKFCEHSVMSIYIYIYSEV